MASETPFLRAIIPSLPTEIAQKVRALCATSDTQNILENLIRLLAGGQPTPDASKAIQDQWTEKQAGMKKVLETLLPGSQEKKRAREDNAQDESSQLPKKQRLSPPTNTTNVNGPNAVPLDVGLPLFTLHSISATSPVRKKVDITIHQNAITMTNSSSRAIECTVPLSSMRRAFVVPTRGKSKPHWTIILLSSDIPDKGKPAQGTSSENQQVIFGVDAASTTPFTTTKYDDSNTAAAQVAPKGSETIPFLREFLSRLNAPLIEPSTAVFKSACTGVGSSAGANGIPGVEAYRAAKSGNLWFAKEGILWGESKPCEFWPVEDLLGKAEGMRLVGSGRTCTVVLTRRSVPQNEMNADEEDVGEETEFGMVDSKEREGINEWVRNHRHLFGKMGPKSEDKALPKVQNLGPMTIRTLMDVSDDEDEDFSASVSDLDGSERSDDDSSSEDEDNREQGDEGDEVGSENDGVDSEGEDEELDPAKHPLLRPGAMPKMSKAALEIAVGIVENGLMGGNEDELAHDDEEDELED